MPGPPAPAGMSHADERTATEAFETLADATRLDILRELGRAEPHGAPTALSFSELRARVGVRDSSRFNYHLQKLGDTFVGQSDDGDDRDGYYLTYAGYTVYRLLVRGVFAGSEPVDTRTEEWACPECGAALAVASRGDGITDVDCPACGTDYLHYEFPPHGATERAGDADDLLLAIDAWARSQLLLFGRGVCPWCGGRVDRHLTTDPDSLPHDVDAAAPAFVRYLCGGCGGGPSVEVEYTVLDHPALVAFCHDHSIDIRGEPIWHLVERLDARAEEPDAPTAVISLAAGGERLRLRVGADGEVATTERESA
jgi:DNA-binding transcriptional ArsR family regulator